MQSTQLINRCRIYADNCLYCLWRGGSSDCLGVERNAVDSKRYMSCDVCGISCFRMREDGSND